MSQKLLNLTYKFMKENYNYLFLKSMIELASKNGKNTTLFVGSSHALNGIDAYCFDNAINCSMHSQDIFYDYLCLKNILRDMKAGTEIKRCFLVFGYYIAFQDLSRGERYGMDMLKKIYYPIFHDLHNCKEDINFDIWERYQIEDKMLQKEVEKNAIKLLEKRRNYYNDFHMRKALYDFNGAKWYELSEEKRLEYGKRRAEAHNKHYNYKESFKENAILLKECTDMLIQQGIMPIVLIPPFSQEYNLYVDTGMKQEVQNLVKKLKDVQLLDLNEVDMGIETSDFLDTDHLNARGAYKVSQFLVKEFGK